MRTLIVALLALGLTGCIVHEEHVSPAPESPGDITFLWSFDTDGKSCLQATDVYSIHVTVENAAGQREQLDNDGFYRCNPGGTDGITLRNFAPGTYSFTVDGLDGRQMALYTASGTVHVNGSVTVPIRLNRVVVQGTVQVFWTFGGKGCSDATSLAGVDGIAQVRVFFGNEAPVNIPCVQNDPRTGQPVMGAAFTRDPGTYTVRIDSLTVHGTETRVWYSGTQAVLVTRGQTTNVAMDLPAAAAPGVNFVPRLGAGGTLAYDCAATLTTTLFIKLTDSTGASSEFANDCAAYAAGGFHWDYLPAGLWTVTIEGRDSPYQGYHVMKSGTIQAPVMAGLPNQTFAVPML
jgi:hypothetical protein